MTQPHDSLFEPFTLGDLRLPNRVVMAPLTRARASQPGDVPNDVNAEYYRQRGTRNAHDLGIALVRTGLGDMCVDASRAWWAIVRRWPEKARW